MQANRRLELVELVVRAVAAAATQVVLVHQRQVKAIAVLLQMSAELARAAAVVARVVLLLKELAASAHQVIHLGERQLELDKTLAVRIGMLVAVAAGQTVALGHLQVALAVMAVVALGKTTHQGPQKRVQALAILVVVAVALHHLELVRRSNLTCQRAAVVQESL